MSLVVIILIILLIVGGVGAGPWWGHSSNWGYGPTGIFGVLLLIVIILMLTGRIG
jgi:flagellin-like protein